MLKVKICGITNLDDARLAVSLGADALGFIFTSKSARYITPEAAKKIIKDLGPFVATVGVFLNQDLETVKHVAAELDLDCLQFHGSETAAYCNNFLAKYSVIKTIFPGEISLAEQIKRYKNETFLFDLPLAQKQQGVRMLSPQILKEIGVLIKAGIRVIISGGLNPKNLSAAAKLKPYALDVASGVERMVGKKDKELVQEFIKKAKSLGLGTK